MSNISYCQCKDSPSSVYGRLSDDCDWTPFIERKDILVWRREHPARKGMYEYKMYGSFDDVTAEEFLSVQLDMSEFRLTWDKSTAQVGLTRPVENISNVLIFGNISVFGDRRGLGL